MNLSIKDVRAVAKARWYNKYNNKEASIVLTFLFVGALFLVGGISAITNNYQTKDYTINETGKLQIVNSTVSLNDKWLKPNNIEPNVPLGTTLMTIGGLLLIGGFIYAGVFGANRNKYVEAIEQDFINTKEIPDKQP